MTGFLVGIYQAHEAGAVLHAVAEGRLEAGKGLVGDRYHAGGGTSSKGPVAPDAEITLIEIEEIERFNSLQMVPFPEGAFRRNLVTRGVRLNDFVGTRFAVGGALLEGKRLCEPCAHLGRLTTPTIVPDMVHRAGLRAQIIRGAMVGTGTRLQPNPELDQ